MPGGDILHAAGIRVRAVGVGNLRPTFYGFDDVLTQVLVPVVMSSTNSRESLRLGNFISQAIKVKLETTALGEQMKVNNITMFISQIYSEHPG